MLCYDVNNNNNNNYDVMVMVVMVLNSAYTGPVPRYP